MKQVLFSVLILLAAFQMKSQNTDEQWQRCGYQQAILQMESNHPGYLSAIQNTFNRAKELQSQRKVTDDPGQAYCVPVVFHVVWNAAENDIPQEKPAADRG